MSERERLSVVEAGDRDAGAAVIWLHGLGANGYDFHPIVPELGLPDDMPVHFVFPHAPQREVTINMGLVMNAWYDIAELSLEARSHDEAGIRESAELVTDLVEDEIERGVRPERIVLAGFSQGGALATHVALRYRKRLAGLIALSSYLLLPDRLEEEASSANRALPIFMGHGDADPVVPFRAGELSRDRLVDAGYDVTWRRYAMPHAVHPREIEDVGAWLRERFTR